MSSHGDMFVSEPGFHAMRGGQGAFRTERILIQMKYDLEAVTARSIRWLPGQEALGQRDGQDVSAERSGMQKVELGLREGRARYSTAP